VNTEQLYLLIGISAQKPTTYSFSAFSSV